MELVLLNRLASSYWRGFCNQQSEGLSTREVADVSPIETANLTKVDQKTFDTLCLAQEAIHYTHQALPKGSSNQVEHLEGNNRAGLPNDGKTVYLDRQIAPVVEKILPLISCIADPSDETVMKFRYGLGAGVAHYYQGGNCTWHAAVAIIRLLERSPVGTKITPYGGTNIDHGFVCIETLNDSGHPIKVICDAYPAHNPQAVLIEDYCIPPEAMKPVCVSFEVTEKNHGINYMERFYDGINPLGVIINEALTGCMRTTDVPSFTPDQVKKMIDCANPPLFYGEHTTKNKEFHEYVTKERKFSDFQANLQQTTKTPACPLKNGAKGIELNPEYVKQIRAKERDKNSLNCAIL